MQTCTSHLFSCSQVFRINLTASQCTARAGESQNRLALRLAAMSDVHTTELVER